MKIAEMTNPYELITKMQLEGDFIKQENVIELMQKYAQQQVKALAIHDVRLTLMLEALEKALIQIKDDVDWSFTDCETWAKRQHEVSAKIELIKELLNEA